MSDKKKTQTVKKQSKSKKSLVEKQEAKLKIQHERQLAKANDENKEQKNKRFYCKPAEMQAELIKWRDSNLENEKGLKPDEIDYTKRKMSDELCKMLMAIADKLLNRSEFRNYSKELKEDAKGYFFYKVMKSGLRNYNFKFNNPFAYFTTCAWNAYVSTIMRHYKHQNTRRDVMMVLLSQLESYTGIDPHSSLRNYIKQYLDSTDPNELSNE